MLFFFLFASDNNDGQSVKINLMESNFVHSVKYEESVASTIDLTGKRREVYICFLCVCYNVCSSIWNDEMVSQSLVASLQHSQTKFLISTIRWKEW